MFHPSLFPHCGVQICHSEIFAILPVVNVLPRTTTSRHAQFLAHCDVSLQKMHVCHKRKHPHHRYLQTELYIILGLIWASLLPSVPQKATIFFGARKLMPVGHHQRVLKHNESAINTTAINKAHTLQEQAADDKQH